jgi:Archaeal/vacuolar-type H+-ATPase subunit F
MKTFLISDNVDTMVGLKIAGIDGIVLHSKEEIEYVIDRLISERETGIIILTEKVASIVPQKIDDVRLNRQLPLIVEIPDRHGSSKDKDSLLGYIKQSIGLKI